MQRFSNEWTTAWEKLRDENNAYMTQILEQAREIEYLKRCPPSGVLTGMAIAGVLWGIGKLFIWIVF